VHKLRCGEANLVFGSLPPREAEILRASHASENGEDGWAEVLKNDKLWPDGVTSADVA
jgi:hypothetical protein